MSRPASASPSPSSNGIPLSGIKKTNERVVKLLENAATQEPKSGRYQWMSGSSSNMQDVVTFRTEGRSKGSLERFVEANGIGKPVYDALAAAAKYGAHTQGATRGLLTFKLTPQNLQRLENRLNQIYERRDADNNGKLDAQEQKEVNKTANGKALLKAMDKINDTPLTGLRKELTFSKKVNYVIDKLYSRGSIRGKAHVDTIAADLPAGEADAVKKAYAAVSRYMSRGRTNQMGFICRDQRREVQRGLMRTFGASLDSTEKAIDALTLPRAYR